MQVSSDFEIPNDSLGMLDLILDLEDKYDIIISDVEAAEVTSKEDLIKLIEGKIKEKSTK